MAQHVYVDFSAELLSGAAAAAAAASGAAAPAAGEGASTGTGDTPPPDRSCAQDTWEATPWSSLHSIKRRGAVI